MPAIEQLPFPSVGHGLDVWTTSIRDRAPARGIVSTRDGQRCSCAECRAHNDVQSGVPRTLRVSHLSAAPHNRVDRIVPLDADVIKVAADARPRAPRRPRDRTESFDRFNGSGRRR